MNRDAPRDAEPGAEREALLQIADGVVVTSGGIAIQRGLETVSELLLTREIGPLFYAV